MVLTIIIFLLTLLVLVVSHEFGHFIVAKKFGIKVLEFGFGLPPKIFSKKWGETIISFNLLPIGGFVRLLGEDEVDQKVLDNARSFAHKSVLQRIGVVIAGVTMNLLLAWVLFYIVLIAQDFRIFYPTTDQAVVVSEVEQGSPAQQSGIKPGDRILAINGKEVKNPDELTLEIKNSANKPAQVTLSDIDKNQQREVTVIPKKLDDGSIRIGIAFPPIPLKTYSTTIEKIFSAPSYSWDLIKLTFQGLGTLIGQLFKGDIQTASAQVAGPIGIAIISNNIISAQAVTIYLWFMGVLSLTLAIMNILPIPALDGGRLFFLLIEAIIGRRVKPEVERMVHAAGMAFLITLIILITFSDIRKLFP